MASSPEVREYDKETADAPPARSDKTLDASAIVAAADPEPTLPPQQQRRGSGESDAAPRTRPAEKIDDEDGDSSSQNVAATTEPAAAPPLPDEPLPETPVPEEPPLPDEPLPESTSAPLPDEPLPAAAATATTDDGWDPVWSDAHKAWYFVNRFTQQTQWDNPRVPTAAGGGGDDEPSPVAGGYNPAIHGDYDPNAWYAQGGGAPVASPIAVAAATAGTADGDRDGEAAFAAAAAAAAAVIQNSLAAVDEHHNRPPPPHGQRRPGGGGLDGWARNGYAAVDTGAAGGASVRAERSGKKPTRAELKAFKEKRRARKEEKRRAWLLD